MVTGVGFDMSIKCVKCPIKTAERDWRSYQNVCGVFKATGNILTRSGWLNIFDEGTE